MIFTISKKQIWDRARKNVLLSIPLLFFAFFYSAILYMRNLLYKTGVFNSESPCITTICVGNITAGGSGKTPVVLYLAEALAREKKSIGILSRGYKGKPPETPWLVNQSDNAMIAGDEAFLLRSILPPSIPVVISPNRVKGTKKLLEQSVEVCLMDDGLQHKKIKPNIKLCLIDLADSEEYLKAATFSVFPYSIFRENPFTGIRSVDRIIFTSRKALGASELDSIQRISRKYNIKEYSTLEIKPDTILDGYTWKEAELPKQKTLTLISSIAKPVLFEESIRSLGFTFDRHVIREDHHSFKKEEWKSIQEATQNPLVCTAKDWIKIRPYLQDKNELFVLTQKVHDRSLEKDKLLTWLEKAITNNT